MKHISAFFKKHRVIKIITLVVIVFGVVTYLSRGPIRQSLVPRYYLMLYKNHLESSVNNEDIKLQHPFQYLEAITSTKSATTECETNNFHLIIVDVTCNSELYSNTIQRPQPDIKQKLQTLGERLHNDNWRSASAVDNTAGFFNTYTKQIGPDSCQFDISYYYDGTYNNITLLCTRVNEEHDTAG